MAEITSNVLAQPSGSRSGNAATSPRGGEQGETPVFACLMAPSTTTPKTDQPASQPTDSRSKQADATLPGVPDPRAQGPQSAPESQAASPGQALDAAYPGPGPAVSALDTASPAPQTPHSQRLPTTGTPPDSGKASSGPSQALETRAVLIHGAAPSGANDAPKASTGGSTPGMARAQADNQPPLEIRTTGSAPNPSLSAAVNSASEKMPIDPRAQRALSKTGPADPATPLSSVTVKSNAAAPDAVLNNLQAARAIVVDADTPIRRPVSLSTDWGETVTARTAAFAGSQDHETASPALPATSNRPGGPAPTPGLGQMATTQAPPPGQATVGSQAWGEAMSQHSVRMAAQGIKQAQVHVHPRDLGPISIHVQMDDQQAAQVHFGAGHAQARDALDQALPQLRQAFSDSGIALGQASIGQDGQTRGQGQSQPHSGQEADSSDDELVDTEVATEEPATSAARGVVDLFA